MTNRIIRSLLLLAALSAGCGAFAQVDCSGSTKLVCQIPFSTGVFLKSGSKVEGANTLGAVFNSAIATQVSQLPLASASSGTVIIGAQGQTLDNLGPILTDRAQTIGKNKVFLAFTASQFYFTDIDGIALNAVPFSYQAVNNGNRGSTYVQENLNVHFKVDQYVVYATFGATNKLDFSVILPIERVSIGSATYGATQYVLDANGNLEFKSNPSDTYTPGTASGLSDITFNAKYLLLSGERSKVAVGLNFRIPTGDDLNYLGSGSWGTNPYVLFSYLAKTSPHIRLGYQWNTETELYPNLTLGHQGTNLALPGGLQYDFGVDRSLTKKLTAAADLMGNQYTNAQRLVRSELQFACTGCGSNPYNAPTVIAANSTYWINDVSAGAKWNPWKQLIFTGNVLFQLNNVGMRVRPTPLIGVSYKFGFH